MTGGLGCVVRQVVHQGEGCIMRATEDRHAHEHTCVRSWARSSGAKRSRSYV